MFAAVLDFMLGRDTSKGKTSLIFRNISWYFYRVFTCRGRLFSNFIVADVGSRVQKGSYIPVKSNGKRDNMMRPAVYGESAKNKK